MNLLVSLILKTKKPWTNIWAYTICLQSAHKVVPNKNCRTLNFEGNSIQYFPNEIFADFDNFCAQKQPRDKLFCVLLSLTFYLSAGSTYQNPTWRSTPAHLWAIGTPSTMRTAHRYKPSKLPSTMRTAHRCVPSDLPSTMRTAHRCVHTDLLSTMKTAHRCVPSNLPSINSTKMLTVYLVTYPSYRYLRLINKCS